MLVEELARTKEGKCALLFASRFDLISYDATKTSFLGNFEAVSVPLESLAMGFRLIFIVPLPSYFRAACTSRVQIAS